MTRQSPIVALVTIPGQLIAEGPPGALDIHRHRQGAHLMVINAGELPIYLRTGTTDELEIGHVEVPLTSEVKDGVRTVGIDMPELKRRLASMFREAADVMEAPET